MSNLISFGSFSPISLIVSYAVNALWQVPLVGAAGWAASWLLRRLGPQAQHVAWVATLMLTVLTPAVPRWHWHASAREGMLARMEDDRALATVPPISHPAVVAPVNSVPFAAVPSDVSRPDVSVAPRRSLAARPRVGRSVAASTPPSLDGSVPMDFAVAGPAVPLVARAPATGTSGVALLPAAAVFALLLCYLGALLYFALRFGWSLCRVARLHREAEPLCFDAESATVWARCRAMFTLGEVRTLLSQGIVGPVTIGFVEPVLLVPVGFLERCSAHDLLATLGHECAHIRRRDFQKNLIYEAASLLIAFHPVTWMLKRQIAQTREMVCDGRAVERLIDVQHYVQALLRLAAAISGGAMGASSPAIGIFDGNILERRILTMKLKRQRVSAARRCGLVLAGAAVLASVVTAGSARAVAVVAKTPITAKIAGASTFAQVTKMFQAVTGRKPGQSSSENMPGAVLKATPAADQINLFAATPAELKNHRLMVMFFDLSSMQAEDSRRAVDATKDFINNHMQPADLVAMVSLLGGLSMDQDFTSDKDLLRKALEKYNGKASAGERNAQSTGRSLDAIRTIAASLEKIDQRKSMLYFSAGWTRQGIENQASMRAATSEAVKAKMSIYAVDARGLEAMPPLPQAAVSPQMVPGESSDAINVSWVQLQALNPDVPPSQQKSVVLQLDGKTISIPGFMVPLQDGANSVNEFLLIPYSGAGIHAPPPPPNQMVYVKMDGNTNVPVTADSILVTGPFKISTVISPYGDLSYVMTGITVKPYTSPEAMAPRQATLVALQQQLDALARRQEELAQQQRSGQQTFQERWQQEMLRREAEQLQREMEQMAQNQQGQGGQSSQQSSSQSSQGGQSSQSQANNNSNNNNGVDPREQQALNRLREANNKMNRNGGQQQQGSGADAAQRAADQLRQATDLLSGTQQQQASGRVDSLTLCMPQVVGNRSVSRESILALLSSHQGDAYDPQVVDRDFNALWNTGYFSDVRVQREDTTACVQLVFYVMEKKAAAAQAPIPGHPGLKAGDEILSDTQGVDFSAYMRRLHDDIQRNWDSLIPEKVAPPTSAKGITGIRFKILPNGEISGILLETRSGDAALDKAAWGAIVSEGKFQPLPKEFHGPNIELRCGFYYNTPVPPDGVEDIARAHLLELERQVRTAAVAYSPQAFAPTAAQQEPVHVSGDVIKAMCVSCAPPAYLRDARQTHVQGEVVMHVILSKDGSVKDLQVISGPELLRDAAMDAVRTWKYKPYLQGGMPVEVDTTITVNFSMNGWHIIPSCDPSVSDCGIGS